MDNPEADPYLALAEGHAREVEERVARQLMLVKSLDARRRHD